MRGTLHIRVAIHAGEHAAMDGILKRLRIDVQANILPFTSCDREASLWQARHSSAVGLGGSFLDAAWSAPAAKRRVRATPGAKRFRIVRVDMLSPDIS